MAMTRFEEAKMRRYFYVGAYRNLTRLIMLSFVLNAFIVLLMAYIYFNQATSSFYSTNGRSYPVELTGLDHPNKLSLPLLPDDEGEVNKNNNGR